MIDEVIVFGSDHCSSCVKWKPVIEGIVNDLQIAYNYVVVDDNPAMKEMYRVTAVPVTVLLQNGLEVARIMGSMSRDTALEQINYFNDGEQ